MSQFIVNVPGWAWLIGAIVSCVLFPVNTKKLLQNPLFESTRIWNIVWIVVTYFLFALALNAFGWPGLATFVVRTVLVFIGFALAGRVAFAILGLRKRAG